MTSLYQSDTDSALTLFQLTVDTDFNIMQQSHGMSVIAKFLVMFVRATEIRFFGILFSALNRFSR